jgi:hypothetical protein
MRTIPSILLLTALFMFCAGCAPTPKGPQTAPSPRGSLSPSKPPTPKPRPDTGSIAPPTTVPQDGGGIYGFLRVKFDPDSPTHYTTWRYRLHSPQGPWVPAAQPYLAMGTSVQLTGNTYYDVKFYPSAPHTVVPNPYNNVLVTADKKTVLELDYSP